MATDFEMFAGDTRKIVVALTDQDGANVDVSDGLVTWQMAASSWKNDPDPDAAVLLTKTSSAGQIELANGSFTVDLQSDDTKGMNAGSYYHEAQVTLADGTIGTPIVGKVKIKANLIEPR